MTTHDIATRYATIHAQRIYLAPGDQFSGLVAEIEAAINYAMELGAPEAEELIRKLRTESGWWGGDQNAQLVLGAFVAQIKQARDEATAAHIITAEKLKQAEIELGEARKLLGLDA